MHVNTIFNAVQTDYSEFRRETLEASTTARWQAAMARAAQRLYRSDAPWQDLRLPIEQRLAIPIRLS